MSSVDGAGNQEKRSSIVITIKDDDDTEAANRSADQPDMRWLCRYLIGAMNGVLVISSSMVGMGAVRQSTHDMFITGLTTLVLGICRIISSNIYTAYVKHNLKTSLCVCCGDDGDEGGEKDVVSCPTEKPASSSSSKESPLVGVAMLDIVAYALGTLIPLVSVVFFESFPVKIVAISVTAGMSLFGFSAITAWLTGTKIIAFAVWGMFYGAASTAISFIVPTAIKYYL